LPPLDAVGVGSWLGALAELLPPELPPEAVSLELEDDDESSEEWLDPAEGGTQSDPLRTVPSGQLPGESAPFPPPPPHAVTETRPAQRAPATTPNPPAFRSFMPRMIALLAND
jgi:hypothetical protein